MSLKNLADKIYPVFIKNFPTDSVCKIFLSASDMKTRAIVQNAQENSPEDAWNVALEKLKKILDAEKIEPKILRADWVTSSEKITWQDFIKLIEKTRRNYFRRGLALDSDYKIAFTETEMNANYMLYRDGKTGSKYCIFRQNYSDDYCEKRFGCKFPTPEPNQTVEVFETCGAFVQDGEEPKTVTGKDIYAGRRDVSAIDQETFLNLAKSGANYLARQVQKNGRFIYGHYPCFDRVVPSYNSLRHFSSTFAMLDVYGAYKKMPPMKLGKAIVNALNYAVKNFIVRRKLDDGTEAAYVNDLGETKLGANGVTLLALVKYTELMHTKKFLPLMNSLANGILSMQNPDGSFVHVLNTENFSVKDSFRIVYYDGEAVFGMMRLYSITKDERLLKASELAFQRFIATNHWQNHDHWLSYAVNELTLYQPDEKYFEFGINNFLSFLPFIYHRDTQFPTLLELMMAADTMLERMKKMPEMAKLLERVNLNDFYAAMEKRAENLLNGFFWPELAMFFANPESIAGSFFIRHHAFRVRIDDVEHFLSGFVAYCRYLERRKNLPAPVPSQELLNGKAEGTGLFNIQSTEKNSAPAETPKTEKISEVKSPAENSIAIESPKVEEKEETADYLQFTETTEPNFVDIESFTFEEIPEVKSAEKRIAVEKNPAEIFPTMQGLTDTMLQVFKMLGITQEVNKNFKAPSDYLGENFDLPQSMKDALRRTSRLPKEKFDSLYETFSEYYHSQKPLKQTQTDLNIYFCDYVLFSRTNGYDVKDYFDYEFYNKPVEIQNTFIGGNFRRKHNRVGNDRSAVRNMAVKSVCSHVFQDYILRDWLAPKQATLQEFKNFIAKHPKFFAKNNVGGGGTGAEIIQIDENSNVEEIFERLRKENKVAEEIISQHEIMKTFCPDTLNTVRINTFLDVHNVVHILTASGRFGRVGAIVDNFTSGGMTVTINPKTGVIISDGLSKAHERLAAHPDTGKIFKGFQYPFWQEIRKTVIKMAKVVPEMRHVGWDIAINAEGKIDLVEANDAPGTAIQQAADSVGRMYLYTPLVEELENYLREEFNLLGYRVNPLRRFNSSYESDENKRNLRIPAAMKRLVPDCESLMDLGCRKDKFAKSVCPENVKYYPVDLKKYDDEIIACDFNTDEFPDFKADTCLCAMTAEYVAELPKFLRKVCNAAQKQILMICRPIDKEIHTRNRWHNQLLTDFTEKFLIKTMQENNFAVNFAEPFAENASFVLYDFRKISADSAEKNLPPVDENKNNFSADDNDKNFSPADNDENNFSAVDKNISVNEEEDEEIFSAEENRPFGEFKIETVGEEKNNYGLPHTIIKACEFLGLKLPEKNSSDDKEHAPSDYFGENFELSAELLEKIRTACNSLKRNFANRYDIFTKKFFEQKPLRHNKTDMNIYFCDYMLFAKKMGASVTDYFDFEFYRLPQKIRDTFRLQRHRELTRIICNDYETSRLLNRKTRTNEIFAEFVHRDWISAMKCTFDEFKNFIAKHPKFFAKPIMGSFGAGTAVIQIDSETDTEKIFSKLKSDKMILEELISQHEIIKSFCPDTLNTVRINTFLDVHGAVHILAASGRFGRLGTIVDNYSSGGHTVTINPKTGIIISDGINKAHERTTKHPDTGKVFKGFQYPFWEKICAAVTKMARLIPSVHHVGWDIAINSEGEVELVEANSNPDVHIQQSADLTGRLYLYQPLINELKNYNIAEIENIGYKVNNVKNFLNTYKFVSDIRMVGIKATAKKLLGDCKSLIDVGCRIKKPAKNLLPADIKYYPVDYKKRGPESDVCNFNSGDFPDIKADTCLCALTAEFISALPKFLKNLCIAAQKQILMVCRPIDREISMSYRWNHQFVTDFTEKFLIKALEENNFKLHSSENLPDAPAIILYDFRRIAPTVEKIFAPTVEEKNIYGLSEGVIKACEFFGLKLPQKIEGDSAEHLPSDYFGENFELNLATMEKLRKASKLDKEKFSKTYGRFTRKFFSQKSLKPNETDLNIYFADYLLNARKNGAIILDYFDFEFYKKSSEVQKTFRMQKDRDLTLMLCCTSKSRELVDNKPLTNELFANFIHRDWIDTRKCSFEEFKNFVEKNPRFFSKPIDGSLGKGAQIIQTETNTDLEKLFSSLREKKYLIEGVIVQHEALSAFCPDTVNTLRINTFLDVHNAVHILTASGRFGRSGRVVDNFHGGGFSVIVDPKTGIITSDGINKDHLRSATHPDTGKVFKGFQYPAWEKVCETVTKMARVLPQIRHVGWDVTINSEDEIELVEANGRPDVDVQQAADSIGRLHLYKPLTNELGTYKKNRLKSLGYSVNDIGEFFQIYENDNVRRNERISFAMKNLMEGCKNLVDLGCRQSKFVKTICPETTKYTPVDFKNYSDAEIIQCDFNSGEFPNISADTYFCAITAEYVSRLPEFLKNICNFAQKQILMLCRPCDKELHSYYRWGHPFLTDFTEEFLIETLKENNFSVNEIKPFPGNRSIILYDFRKISQPVETILSKDAENLSEVNGGESNKTLDEEKIIPSDISLPKINKKTSNIYLRADAIAKALGEKWEGNTLDDWDVRGICSNIKVFKPGQIFLLVRSKYPRNVIKSVNTDIIPKCTGIICKKDAPSFENVPVLRVEDTFMAIKILAKIARENFGGKVIGVTGTSGKTSTCALLHRTLRSHYSLANSFSGYGNVYLECCRELASMRQEGDFLVLEMSAAVMGGIIKSGNEADVFHPDVSIITNIGAGHLQGFKTLERAAQVKSVILDNMAAGNLAVIFREIQYFEIFQEKAQKRGLKILTFGESEDADFRLLKYTDHSMTFSIYGKIYPKLELKAVGKHRCLNALAIMATLHGLDLPIEPFLPAISSFTEPAGRGRTSNLLLPDGTEGKFTLIDDAYNANPLSLRTGLDTLRLTKKSGVDDIIILGDMLELGEDSAKYHEELAPDILKTNPKKVFLCGNEMKFLWDKISDKVQGKYFSSVDDLIADLPKFIHADNRVFVKGSHSSNVWQVVSFLRNTDLNIKNSKLPIKINQPKPFFDIKEFLPEGITPEQNGNMPEDRLQKIHCGGLLYTDAARSWLAMVRAAAKDGVFFNVNRPEKAYRSLQMQQNIFSKRFIELNGKNRIDVDAIHVEFDGKIWQLKKNSSYAMIPGQSSHSYGLAIDIANAHLNYVKRWLDKNAESFGWVKEYDFEQWHYVYIKSCEGLPARVLDIESLPPEPKYSAKQIEETSGCKWLENPPVDWTCGGMFYKRPFRAGYLVVADQGDGIGIAPKLISVIFRQLAGIVCTRPEELEKFNLPLLVTDDIKGTVKKLSNLFDEK